MNKKRFLKKLDLDEIIWNISNKLNNNKCHKNKTDNNKNMAFRAVSSNNSEMIEKDLTRTGRKKNI